MKAMLTFAIGNPALLVVPLLAFAFSLVVLCFKKRYVNVELCSGVNLPGNATTELRNH